MSKIKVIITPSNATCITLRRKVCVGRYSYNRNLQVGPPFKLCKLLKDHIRNAVKQSGTALHCKLVSLHGMN